MPCPIDRGLAGKARSPRLPLVDGGGRDDGIRRQVDPRCDAARRRDLFHCCRRVRQRVGDRAARGGLELTCRRRRAGLPVREVPDRRGAFGDRVGRVAPGLHELVELEVQRAEVAADGRPVELLGEQ
jgi:hypothetical protein